MHESSAVATRGDGCANPLGDQGSLMQSGPTLQFVLFVDNSCVDGDWETLYRLRMRERSFDATGNYVEIKQNVDFDRSKMDDDDGYLFFPFRMEFTPSNPRRTEDQQVQLARAMKEVLEYIGCRIVVGANFEDRV